MPLKPIEKNTLQETVYEEILRAILCGELAPGERITLMGLSKQLKVGIMPVRETIRRLEGAKYLEVNKKGRIKIKEFPVEDWAHLYEVRVVLESFAVREAMENWNKDLQKQLDASYEKVMNAEDDETILQTNKKFHFLIYQQANNPILLELIESLWEKVLPYVYLRFKKTGWNIDKVRKYHCKMLEGMRRKRTEDVVKWLKIDLVSGAKLIAGVPIDIYLDE